MAIDYLRQYVKAGTSRAEREVSPAAGAQAIEQLLDGHLIAGPDGACFVTETRRDTADLHGLHAFGGLGRLSADRLSIVAKDPELAYADLSRAVFLDTETTGLNMGTGTYVFLVGAGFFENGCFRVRQFFLRSPGEETSYLAALDSFLRGFSVLITFNGKAFDWPLLESRFIGHREFRRAPLDDPPHIDLLHPARRLWKKRLENCRLSSLEQSILAVHRTEDDVPGWLIPSLYFSYLRSGDGCPLRRVFYHNLQDILSLAALTIHLDTLVGEPMCGLICHPSDFICLARTYEHAGDIDRAVACLEEALRLGPDVSDRHEGLLRLAAIYKRERRWDAALSIWDRLLDVGMPGALFALVERAKYYEHVEREYLDALDDVQHAFNLLELAGATTCQIDRQDLEHRRGRLLNRVYKSRSWAT